MKASGSWSTASTGCSPGPASTPRPGQQPAPRARPHEHFRALHPPSDRDVAADGGAGAGRNRGVSAAAGGAAAAGGFPHHLGPGAAAGRQPGRDGGHRGAAARAPLRPNLRRHADDVGQHARLDLDHNIDGAAQDVQAAITAAGRQLPNTLSTPPTYRKVNPADSPVLVLAVRSDTLPLTTVDDFADRVMAQQISQITGVAQVIIGGEQKPAIRVQVDPAKLQTRGLTFEDVRGVLAAATTQAAKGSINDARQSFTIMANDQLVKSGDYNDVIIAYRNGAPIRVRDVGHAIDGPEDRNIAALTGEKPAVILLVFKQPGANVIDTVDQIKAAMPRLYSIIPPGMKVDTIVDRTQTIRASVADVEFTLSLTI